METKALHKVSLFALCIQQMNRLLIAVLLVIFAAGGHVTAVEHLRCPDRDGPCFVCVRYCARCVEMYGRDNYNGRLCANDCVRTNGGSQDEDCENTKYHTVD